jgi:hypothetical protein
MDELLQDPTLRNLCVVRALLLSLQVDLNDFFFYFPALAALEEPAQVNNNSA